MFADQLVNQHHSINGLISKMILSWLDKASRALCRTHICRTWYAFIPKEAPWTVAEIKQYIKAVRPETIGVYCWTSFYIITLGWQTLPHSPNDRWRVYCEWMARNNCPERVHWLTSRFQEPAIAGSAHPTDIMTPTDALRLAINHSAGRVMHALRTHIPNLGWESRLRLFWDSLMGACPHFFRDLLNLRIVDTRRLRFDKSQSTAIGKRYMWTLSKERLPYLRENLRCLAEPRWGVPGSDFWDDWMVQYAPECKEVFYLPLLVEVATARNRVPHELCAWLKRRVKGREDIYMPLHDRLAPYCQCEAKASARKKAKPE